jgi:putative hydrolase of the HAD superfamily
MSLSCLKAIALDWGHTLIHESRDAHIPLAERPIHLMPGVLETLPVLHLPLALWANTRNADERDVRAVLRNAGLEQYFQWVITSVDAGARKPAPMFFDYALRVCGLTNTEVLFVGNQLNTDIAGGEAYGISTVWLSGHEYRSNDDDRACIAMPKYVISNLCDLPALVQRIRSREAM